MIHPLTEPKQPFSDGSDTAVALAATFEQSSARVLGRLQQALADVLNAAPERIHKAADVERVFGVDHRLGWQVFRMVRARNPMAVGPHVPARVSMERLVKAAGRRGLPPTVTEPVLSAYGQFEELVQQHAGSRAAFNGLVAGTLPEEQEKLHLASRESLHEAAKNIRGVAMETSLITHILFPSPGSPDRLDGLHLVGNFGVHRIRRDATVETSALCRDQAGANLQTIDGTPVSSSSDVLLHRFCSQPVPKLAVHKGQRSVRFVLEGNDVGTRAAVDSVFADVLPGYRSRFALPDRPMAGVAHATDAPARWQVIDVLVCDGIVPRQDPIVQVYDMVPHGQIARVPDPDRELDRVAYAPPARYMGRGLESFRCVHLGQYQEMLAYVCERRGWDPSMLHGYRVEIEYPVYSWQTVLALRLPNAPTG